MRCRRVSKYTHNNAAFVPGIRDGNFREPDPFESFSNISRDDREDPPEGFA